MRYTQLNHMRLLVVCAIWALCSCGPDKTVAPGGNDNGNKKDDRVYTADELGWIIEWRYRGYDKVYNETDGTVALTVFCPDDQNLSELISETSVIASDNYLQLEIGDYLPGHSVTECVKVKIKFGDGTEFECEQGGRQSPGSMQETWKNAWSEHFFKDCQQKNEYEVTEMDGYKIRHDLIVRTYHVDDELVEIWRAGQ